MEIDIEIDSLTNCLVCRETGEQLDTEFRLVLKTITKKDAAVLQRNGWKFDWSIPHQHDYEVYELPKSTGDDSPETYSRPILYPCRYC